MSEDRESSIGTGVALVGFLLTFVAGAGLARAYDLRHGAGAVEKGAADGAGAWSDAASPVAIDSKDPMWGHRDAPVTIVEFSDFQCPFCSRVEPTLAQVKSTYGPDKVRIVWKNDPLPFHPNAQPAAEAAMGVFALAGNDAFWTFHDTAFKNQPALGTDSYVKWAAAAGVKDAAAFKAGLDAHRWRDKVDKDTAEMNAIGQQGTPAFFINGVALIGAQSFDTWKTILDKELEKARATIARGVPADQVYVRTSQENKQNAPAPSPAAAAAPKPAEDPNAVFVVPPGDSPVTWGDAKAKVTIVEFSDFQCPFCKRVDDTLQKLHAQYGDKVRLVVKNAPLPFHARAEPAAELAMEARAEQGDKGFWKARTELFASAPKLENDDLDRIASDLGLSADKAHDAVANHKWKKAIDTDAALAASVKADALPHFFINGHRLVGAVPLERFQTIIDQELAGGATAKVAAGR